MDVKENVVRELSDGPIWVYQRGCWVEMQTGEVCSDYDFSLRSPEIATCYEYPTCQSPIE